MPQEHRDRADIDACFQQVRRKAMTQGRDAVAVRDPCGPLRVIGDVLGGADGQRRVGIEAGKQPRSRPVESPVGAQCSQEAGGE